LILFQFRDYTKIQYLIGFWKLSFKSAKDQQYDIAGSTGKMKCHVTEISATTLCEAISVFFFLHD